MLPKICSLARTAQRKHSIIRAFAFVASIVMFVGDANAQGTRIAHSRDRTRGYIDDYTNSYTGENDFETPRRPVGRVPGDGGNFDLKALRLVLRSFTDGVAQLTYALNDQIQSNQGSGLRQVYMEALRLSGTAASIYKRAERMESDGMLVDDLRQLDADWRELAYRLESARGMGADAKRLVTEINDAEHRMRQLINIQPQFDRRQLYLKSAGLAADLENLQEDIAAELGNGPNARVYRQAVGRLRQVVLNLISVVRDDHADSSIIVEEFKQFEAQWTPLVAKLRTEEDRYVERSLRRVAASANEMRQLLLMPHTVDQTQYAYLAKSLKRDIDEFFERTPLILVMQLPKSKSALGAAEQFYSACNHFVEIVGRTQDQAELLDAFRRVEQAERVFIEVYRDVDSDRAVAVLNRIGQSMTSLRSAMQIQRDDFDSQSAEELAASVQNFTEQIENATKRWLEEDSQPFANNCLQDVSSMTDRAARLHDDIVSGRPQNELQTEMTDLYDTWRRVYNYLTKCQTQERPALGRLASGLTPAMVDLRTTILQ
jgi:hypothetical protein